MRALVLGGDGYLGWPTAAYFAAQGHDVTVVDNYLRRNIADKTNSEPLVDLPDLEQRVPFQELYGHKIKVRICDLADPDFMFSVVKDVMPDINNSLCRTALCTIFNDGVPGSAANSSK